MNKLTEKQIEHWRKVLIPMFGPYASMMPVEEIELIRDSINEAFGQPNKDEQPNGSMPNMQE